MNSNRRRRSIRLRTRPEFGKGEFRRHHLSLPVTVAAFRKAIKSSRSCFFAMRCMGILVPGTNTSGPSSNSDPIVSADQTIPPDSSASV